MIKFFSALCLLLFFQTTDFEKAQKLYQQQKYVEAKILFEKCLKDKPNDQKTIEYLGDIAGHQKRWNDAIGYYKTLKIAQPNNANFWYKYGGALGMKAKDSNKFKALGMLSDIENAFLTAAKIDPKHIDTRWALVMYYIEVPGIVGGSERNAKKYATELMQISKVDGYLALGCIDEYFHRYEKAEKSYITAFEIGRSKTTYQKLYNLYQNKLNNTPKAKLLKENFEK